MMRTNEITKKKVKERNLVLCLTFYLNSFSREAWEKMYRDALHTFLYHFCFFYSVIIYFILSINAEETIVKSNASANFMLDCGIKTH